MKSCLHDWSTGASEVAGVLFRIIWSFVLDVKSYLHGWSTGAGEVAEGGFIIIWSFVLDVKLVS